MGAAASPMHSPEVLSDFEKITLQPTHSDYNLRLLSSALELNHDRSLTFAQAMRSQEYLARPFLSLCLPGRQPLKK